ncbi:MAG: hypothetical protein INR72_19020 [Williamsia herbipolensis]|nr:hypothetical protein [Williamsia herbipolensis]
MAADECDVWLTEWQVAEDGFDAHVGEHVTWDLVPMDDDWVDRLWAGRRSIGLQRDTYWDGPEGAVAQRVPGTVVRIDQVSVRYVQDPDGSGLVPEDGAARQQAVSSLWPRVPHHGSIVGWVVTLRPDP